MQRQKRKYWLGLHKPVPYGFNNFLEINTWYKKLHSVLQFLSLQTHAVHVLVTENNVYVAPPRNDVHMDTIKKTRGELRKVNRK
jgi:hypothetical protein